jgi:hypothetical protein
MTCTFTPASLVATGDSPVTSTLVVRTTSTIQLASAQTGFGPASWSFGLLGLVGVVLMGAGRKQKLLLGLFLVALLMALAGCGDSSHQPASNPNATPLGQATVTVNATAGSGGSTPQHSVQLSINVTQ